MSVDITVPPAGESVTEAEIANWNKKTGDPVQLDEIVGELETEKANLEIRSPAAGTLQLKKAVGDTVQIGEVIALVEEGANQPTPASSKSNSPPAAPPSAARSVEKLEAPTAPPARQSEDTVAAVLSQPTDRSFAPPSVRRLMRERSLSSAAINSAGSGGRLTKAALEETLSQASSSPPAPAAAPLQNGSSALPTRPHTKKKLSRLRKTIAARLVKAQQTAALLTTVNEIDMHAVMELRKTYKAAFKEKYEVGLGFMSFFAKAVVLALEEFPVVHSFIHADEIVTPAYCDLGIAVATPKGLVVPVVRDAHQKTFSQLEKVILTLAQKGRAGKLSLDELSGGTFSITNGGVFGSMLSTPIVNYPQAAILGMHNIVSRPTVVGEQIVIRPIMYVALTYDHRLIDGAEAVQFLVRVKQLIEDPRRLLLAV